MRCGMGDVRAVTGAGSHCDLCLTQYNLMGNRSYLLPQLPLPSPGS